MKPKIKIAILGFAREGQSTLRFIKKQPEYREAEIWVLDQNPSTKIPADAKGILGKNYLDRLGQFDLIFRAPGIPYNLPALKKARRVGVEFSSQTKLFFEHCAGTIIGITGTKGKSTTSTLIYNILKAAKKKATLAGNIGSSTLDSLPKINKKTYAVLELSSFQLQDLEESPEIAVVLDVFSDHQDSHLDLNEYYGAKANIARYQKRGNKIFFFKNSPKSRWIAQKSPGQKIAVDEKKFKLFGEKDLKIRGFHAFRNAVMAANVAMALGVPAKTVYGVVKNFRGLEHRLEFARKIGSIKFYNDSASTNPHTSAVAVKSFPDELKILITGGRDQNLNYSYKPLAEALKKSNTKLVVLFGENKNKIRKQVASSKVPIVFCDNLQAAVKTAYRYAKNLPIAIIFSPGAKSFDQFKNYADRGEQFKRLVNKLPSK